METITGRVAHMFNNCPKVSGWFGCFFDADDYCKTIRVTGDYKGPITMGMRFAINGNFVGYTDFEAVDMRPILPSGKNFIRYLKSVKGVGAVTANRIYDKYGEDTAYVIEFEKDKLKTDLNLSDKLIVALYTAITGESAENQIKKSCPFLTPSVINKLAEAYNMDFMSVFTLKPYSMLYEISGLSFEDVDKIAMRFGTKYNDPERIKQCMCYALYKYMNDTGDMYLNLQDVNNYNMFWRQYLDNVNAFMAYPFDEIRGVSVDLAAVTKTFVDYAFNQADEDSIVNEHGRLYLTTMYNQEKELAELIANIVKGSSFVNSSESDIVDAIAEYENINNKTLDNEQREAVISAMNNRLSVITGGPGRGKTDTIACIMYVWKKLKHTEPVLCAPTGMAVRKLKEGTHGDVMTAMYRILKDKFVSSGNLTATTRDNEIKKKTGNLFIVDETSMFDWFTAYNILKIYKACQIVFVGDVNQLPPIGKGQFFRDLCKSDDVPHVTLLTNHRSLNVQSISENADKMNEGIMSDSFIYDDAFQGLWIDEYSAVSHIIDIYLSHIKNSVGMIDNDKINDICLISPTRYGCLGTIALNQRIQDEVNPAVTDADVNYKTINSSAKGTPIKGLPFGDDYIRIGSRVMITKNQKDESGNLLFYNGECGFITHYELDCYGGEEIIFLSETGEIKTIENKDIKNITLAYAVTVHKSQGSEYKTIVFASQESLLRMSHDFSCRNLVYTAVTRAKERVYIVGNREAFDLCIFNEPVLRNTRLTERIKDVM